MYFEITLDNVIPQSWEQWRTPHYHWSEGKKNQLTKLSDSKRKVEYEGLSDKKCVFHEKKVQLILHDLDGSYDIFYSPLQQFLKPKGLSYYQKNQEQVEVKKAE